MTASTAPSAPTPSAPTAPAIPETVVLSAQNLTRRYGTGRTAFTAVDGIDLEIARGELFALLGTNGAGKTSTLEVLEGLAPATSGTVRAFGRDPYRHRRYVRPRQGLMLQTGGFPADLTAREALNMWCSTLSTPRPVGALLEEVDMSDRAATRISSLSGGEVRRLDLACALAGDPELLFLDEPSTGLDPESRARALDLVRRQREKGTTIVLTTHYLDEAEQLADRLAIMHHGRIVRQGTVDQVVADHPASIRAIIPRHAPALPDLRGTVTRGTDLLQVQTAHLQHDLGALLRWADEHDLTLERLDARAASLESVFLDIAGTDPSADTTGGTR